MIKLQMSNIFQRRIDCWKDTKNISNILPLPPQSIKCIYDNHFVMDKKYEKSNIMFFDMDSIDCCIKYAPDALVLNLADDNFPGGCVDMGSGAQEESLFRRTNYNSSLLINLYPIKQNEVIYSPNISIIKTNEIDNWHVLDINNPQKISFIACPGIKYPTTIVDNKGETRLNNFDSDILRYKIATIIQTAVKFNHNTIIFGALGCGAWKNPIKHVAEIFNEILTEYDGVILNFYFAILTTDNNNYIVRNQLKNNKKTIDIFKEVFANNSSNLI